MAIIIASNLIYTYVQNSNINDDNAFTSVIEKTRITISI